MCEIVDLHVHKIAFNKIMHIIPNNFFEHDIPISHFSLFLLNIPKCISQIQKKPVFSFSFLAGSISKTPRLFSILFYNPFNK